MAKKSTQKRIGVKGKLRKVEGQLRRKLVPVQRLRQRRCAITAAVAAGRKTISKQMRAQCAREFPLNKGPLAGADTMPNHAPLDDY